MALFEYKTYPDVRTNLFKYSLGLFNVLGLVVYSSIISPTHRAWLSERAAAVTSNPLAGAFGQLGLGVAVFTGLAYVLVEVLKIYDDFYDRYMIKWRCRHDSDFILPRLCAPFLWKTNPGSSSIGLSRTSPLS